MIRINQLKLQIPHTEEALEKKIQKTLHLKKGDSFTYRIHRQWILTDKMFRYCT